MWREEVNVWRGEGCSCVKERATAGTAEGRPSPICLAAYLIGVGVHEPPLHDALDLEEDRGLHSLDGGARHESDHGLEHLREERSGEGQREEREGREVDVESLEVITSV